MSKAIRCDRCFICFDPYSEKDNWASFKEITIHNDNISYWLSTLLEILHEAIPLILTTFVGETKMTSMLQMKKVNKNQEGK